MNYRHAYHAGNFADVVKHSLLTRILIYLKQKEKPFRVIDTHAGIGLYDLTADEAQRTGEASNGVERLVNSFDPKIEALLAPYRDVLAAVRARFGETIYPGSPAIIRELLRSQDRGVFVELHPTDYEILNERFNMVTNTKVMHLDAWVALRSLIPPREKRGLVLIDPPFEEPNELTRMVQELCKAVEKWPTGIFAAWYPIKDVASVDNAWEVLKKYCSRAAIRTELLVERPTNVTRLNGCGLFIVNPPWTLAGEAEQLLSALSERFAMNNYGAYRVEQHQ